MEQIRATFTLRTLILVGYIGFLWGVLQLAGLGSVAAGIAAVVGHHVVPLHWFVERVLAEHANRRGAKPSRWFTTRHGMLDSTRAERLDDAHDHPTL